MFVYCGIDSCKLSSWKLYQSRSVRVKQVMLFTAVGSTQPRGQLPKPRVPSSGYGPWTRYGTIHPIVRRPHGRHVGARRVQHGARRGHEPGPPLDEDPIKWVSPTRPAASRRRESRYVENITICMAASSWNALLGLYARLDPQACCLLPAQFATSPILFF